LHADVGSICFEIGRVEDVGNSPFQNKKKNNERPQMSDLVFDNLQHIGDDAYFEYQDD
jgi:hypothetical protein